VGNKNRKKRMAASVSPGANLEAELGLDPAVWSVGVGYGKTFLSGSRFGHVTVRHIPSDRERSTPIYATGKAALRREAAGVVMRLVRELQSG
jgi:hypothetical protein